MAEQEHARGTPGVWKQPNFLLIVILFGAVILIGLASAYTLIRTEGKHIAPQAKPNVPSQN
jgi:hypothetical protein